MRQTKQGWSQTPVRELAHRPMILKESSSLEEAIATLQDPQAHCLMIVNDEGVLTGIFTEEVVLNRIFGENLPSDEIVGNCMDRDFYSTDESSSVLEAFDQMGQKRLKYLAITNAQKQPVGIVSIRWMVDFINDAVKHGETHDDAHDLEKALHEVVRLPMSFVLTSGAERDCIMVSGSDGIVEVAESIKGQIQMAALVFENGNCDGLLRIRDVPFKVLHRDRSAESMPVKNFMTKKPEFVDENDTIGIALQKISSSGMLYLSYKNNTAMALVSARDIMTYIYRHIHEDE